LTGETSRSRPHILLSCGEASGDRYGAALVRALRARLPEARFSALGGDALAAEPGVEIVQDAASVAVMGVGEIFGALGDLRRARARLRAVLAEGDVDLFVPVDFPGFNLPMAGFARGRGVPVLYVVAPQLWAWGSWRSGRLRRSVDRLVALLPFEVEFFRARAVPVVHLGHPLLEEYPFERLEAARRRREARLLDAGAVLTVGLLPGSRRQEVRALLPVLLETFALLKARHPERTFRGVLSRAPGSRWEPHAPLGDDLEIVETPLASLLPTLDLALVCSGTASLETALAAVPHAVVYRTSPLTYWLARRLVRVERIGLANLVLGGDLVREFVQGDVDAAALADDLDAWLGSASRRARFGDGVETLRSRLGGEGFWTRLADLALKLCRAKEGLA
jgi:lipid-A-disaccharide synthase